MTDITGLPDALAVVDDVTIRLHATGDAAALEALAAELATRAAAAQAAGRVAARR
jgi:hypothetical protein